MKIARLAAAVPLLALLAAGCASVPMAPPERDLEVKRFEVKPGKANVYVFRDESIGAAVKMPVALDGKIIGTNVAKTFLFAEVEPGPHKLSSHAENTFDLDLAAAAGQNLFVWQEVKMGVLYARTKLQVVDEQRGRAGVSECKLAAPEGN
jgi:hypothetical protein